MVLAATPKAQRSNPVRFSLFPLYYTQVATLKKKYLNLRNNYEL